MKTRVISAAVLLPVLLVILLAAPKIVAAIVWGILLGIGVYELLYCTGLVREPLLIISAAAMAFAVTLWSYFDAIHAFGLLLLMLYIAVLFTQMMMEHVKITFDKIAMCLAGGALIPYLLSSVIRILTLNIGKYLVLIPFLVSFTSDAGAYFAGYFFGKHKMAPVISQHKTVEGAIGGVLSAMLGMVIYALIMQISGFQVNYLYAVVYGLVGSGVGIFGDLCFSVIKRQTGIKDYGNLIPGHGGFLDRFDSMTLVGPMMEVLLIILPVAV